jgi:hypothetical protein
MPDRKLKPNHIRWARGWMTLVLVGLMIFAIGVEPDIIGMDRSPVVGFVQVGVWLTGLTVMLLAAYALVRVVRNGRPNSLRADIGVRLVATGYVISAAASLADYIGVGAQRLPNVAFGPLQVIGLVGGIVISVLGLILYWPWALREKQRERKRRFPLPRLRFGRKGRAKEEVQQEGDEDDPSE